LENVCERDIVHQSVEVRPVAKLQLVFVRQEAQDRVGGGRYVVGPDHELSPVARGQDEYFFYAL